MTYYTIKPLKWTYEKRFKRFVAYTTFGEWCVYETLGGSWVCDDETGWAVVFATTENEARILGEERYRSRLLSALEPVEEKP